MLLEYFQITYNIPLIFMDIVTGIILLVSTAFVCGLLMQRLHQPLILGYILAGVLLGPHTGADCRHGNSPHRACG